MTNEEAEHVERRCALLNRWFPWIEHHAERESETGFRVLTFSEFVNMPSPPAFVVRNEEEAFRRGYWHGYSQALDDLEAATGYRRRSKAWQAVARFFDGALSRWRGEGHEGERKEPPSFDGKP